MSGYFGALMRASGLAIPGLTPAPPLVTSRPAAAPIVETDVERAPAMRPPEPQQLPAEHMAPAGRGPEVVQPARPLGDAPHRDVSHVPAGRVVAETGNVHPAPGAPVPEVGERGRTGEAPKRDVGESLVRAAMQWVAEDPATVRRPPAPAEIHQERAAPRPDRHDSTTTAPPERALERHIERTPSSATVGVIPAPGEIESDEPVAVAPPSFPLPHPRAVIPSPLRAMIERDEAIEVVIGAIHVRVDAPKMQTVTKAAPPPPVQSPRAAATAPTRSALSRRALRRV